MTHAIVKLPTSATSLSPSDSRERDDWKLAQEILDSAVSEVAIDGFRFGQFFNEPGFFGRSSDKPAFHNSPVHLYKLLSKMESSKKKSSSEMHSWLEKRTLIGRKITHYLTKKEAKEDIDYAALKISQFITIEVTRIMEGHIWLEDLYGWCKDSPRLPSIIEKVTALYNERITEAQIMVSWLAHNRPNLLINMLPLKEIDPVSKSKIVDAIIKGALFQPQLLKEAESTITASDNFNPDDITRIREAYRRTLHSSEDAAKAFRLLGVVGVAGIGLLYARSRM